MLTQDVGSSTASLTLASGTSLVGAYTYSVKDLTFNTTADKIAGTIAVYGTYTPAAVDAYYPVMMDGSTLDLSGLTEPAEPTAANFDSGTVTIALGARALAANQTIVTWTAKPANVTFAFTGDNIVAGKTFTVSDSGIIYDAASDVVASATWTGLGEAGNWQDPNNWSCKDASGNPMSGKVPGTDLTVTFTGDVAAVAFNGDFPFAGAYLNQASLSKAVDWSGFDLDLLTDASLLDLMGCALTISAAAGESTTAATITNSLAEAAVTLVVGADETFTNSTLALTGNIKLVKDGAGTFVATKYPQDYTGVTEVKTGVLKCADWANMNANGASKAANAKSVFGAARTIDLPEGSALDPAGSYAWAYHTINLKGGIISNTVQATGIATKAGEQKTFDTKNGASSAGRPFNPRLILEAEALIVSTTDFNFQGVVEESDNRLNVEIASGTTFLWNPTFTTNLQLKVTGAGAFGVWCKNPVAYDAQPGLQLEMAGGYLNLATHSTYGTGSMHVGDYLADGSDPKNYGGAPLYVHGTFTPASDYFYGCTLLDGSSIDLSAKSGPWTPVSQSYYYSEVQFSVGATVAVDVVSRVLEPGEKVIAWETKPVGVTFVFEGENVDPDVKVRADADGLYYGYAAGATIVFVNTLGDGDLTNPQNWEGGEVPTTIKAALTGDVSRINVPAGKTFGAQEIWFKDAHLSQDADMSWLDLDRLTDESIIDLKGSDLVLSGSLGACTSAGLITDSAAEGGTVRFVVPSGATYTNASFRFSGSLSFVKQGEGVLVAAAYPQEYSGMTTVAEGGIRCAEKANLDEISQQSPFGSTGTVTLDEGAFLDPAGSYNWGNQTIVMNGGVISNTVAESGMNNDNFNAAAGSFVRPFNPTIDLRTDSTFVTRGYFNFKGQLVANGHKLTMVVPTAFRWFPTEADNAVVEFTGTGSLKTLKNFTINQPTMTLVMNGPTFDAGGNCTVSNYVAMSATAFSEIRNNDNMALYVNGTFTPVANDFFGCTMLNGSKIDLSNHSGTLNVARMGKANPGAVEYVHFAANATVTIDVGVRTLSSRTPIVSWTDATRPADGVTFVLNDEAQANHYKIDVRDDGIYATRSGFVLMIK